MRSLRSLDDGRDLGMGGQQRRDERVVEREHAEEGDDDRLVDARPPRGAPDAVIPGNSRRSR